MTDLETFTAALRAMGLEQVPPLGDLEPGTPEYAAWVDRWYAEPGRLFCVDPWWRAVSGIVEVAINREGSRAGELSLPFNGLGDRGRYQPDDPWPSRATRAEEAAAVLASLEAYRRGDLRPPIRG